MHIKITFYDMLHFWRKNCIVGSGVAFKIEELLAKILPDLN